MLLNYIFGNGTFGLIFQEETFRAEKVKLTYSEKNFLYFRKWNFLAPSLKSVLYFKMNLKNINFQNITQIVKNKLFF